MAAITLAGVVVGVIAAETIRREQRAELGGRIDARSAQLGEMQAAVVLQRAEDWQLLFEQVDAFNRQFFIAMEALERSIQPHTSLHSVSFNPDESGNQRMWIRGWSHVKGFFAAQGEILALMKGLARIKIPAVLNPLNRPAIPGEVGLPFSVRLDRFAPPPGPPRWRG